jgi:hypothetical protein
MVHLTEGCKNTSGESKRLTVDGREFSRGKFSPARFYVQARSRRVEAAFNPWNGVPWFFARGGQLAA